MGLVRPGMKGKEKEKEKEKAVPVPITTTAAVEETMTTYTPYLAPISRSAPHPVTTDRSPWSKRGSLDISQTQTQAQGHGGTREGIEERLKMLKRVDDTIWGLVEELTRIRSLMDDDSQAEVEGRVDGVEM
jgi:hypothetical protein